MVLNATFKNTSVILWRSVLLVEETGLPGENILPATSHFGRVEMWSSVANTINVSWSANVYLKK